MKLLTLIANAQIGCGEETVILQSTCDRSCVIWKSLVVRYGGGGSSTDRIRMSEISCVGELIFMWRTRWRSEPRCERIPYVGNSSDTKPISVRTFPYTRVIKVVAVAIVGGCSLWPMDAFGLPCPRYGLIKSATLCLRAIDIGLQARRLSFFSFVCRWLMWYAAW